MLIRLTDKDGRETWINPIHVRIVRQKHGMLGGKTDVTEVWFSFHAQSEAIYFGESPAEIAAALNAGMPPAYLIATNGEDEPPAMPHSSGTAV